MAVSRARSRIVAARRAACVLEQSNRRALAVWAGPSALACEFACPPILQTLRLSSNPSLGNTRQVQREAGWGKSRRAVQGCRGALQQYQELWPATDFDDTTFSLIASVVRNPGGSGNPMSGVVVADSDSAPPRASISSALITSASSAARRSPSRSGREPARACFSCPTSPIRSQRSARSSPPG